MISPSKQAVSEAVAVIKTKFNLADDQRVILCVGRLIERKGQSDLIRSMPQILSVFPNTILIIVGRGLESNKLQKLVDELGLRNHVIFSGFVDDDELAALYNLCDVFALPHKELEDGDTEGCPTVFLEANAHGKPVVGGDAGGVRDAIINGVTGFLGDCQLAKQMGEHGRQRVLNDLTPQKGVEHLLAFCRNILEERADI
jgi:phosphatidylinositol alpha-1,6-mannosyltransferase